MVQGATRDLIALVDAHLPQRIYARHESSWGSAGPALIVRIADLAASMADLAEARRPSHVLILLRALYEHVVTFCWLAIDPATHVERWVQHAQFWQAKLHKDLSTYGEELLSDEQLALAEQSAQMPSIADRADAIDRHWGERLSGFRTAGEFLSFRGLYTLYRGSSRSAHAQADSVDSCVDTTGYPWVVHHENDSGMLASALAIPLFTMALTVCHERFRWPDPDRARAINEAFIAKPSADPGADA